MICFGHRGACGHEPENTLRSIRRALELGAQGIEIDVRNVAGELLVFHDARLERTTNGRGYLSRQPLEYLRSSADTGPLTHAAQVSGGHDQAKPTQVWDAQGEKVPYTEDLWPYVLLVVAGLFILDLYAKRVRLFGYRTIKFN